MTTLSTNPARAREESEAGGAPALEANGLRKTYRLGRVRTPVLRGVDLRVREGEWVAILGASGSGKSTLLHLLGGLDRPDARGADGEGGGEIRFRDAPLGSMSTRRLDRYRNEEVGFVFQFYHLLPELTVLENVVISAMIRLGRFGYLRRRAGVRDRARSLLDSFGMSHRLAHRPAELSGGERQRVALARALINEPALLLADEPTGNLDAATGGQILDCIEALRDRERRTMVMVTHDPAIAARADRRVRLLDGRVVAEAAES